MKNKLSAEPRTKAPQIQTADQPHAKAAPASVITSQPLTVFAVQLTAVSQTPRRRFASAKSAALCVRRPAQAATTSSSAAKAISVSNTVAERFMVEYESSSGRA